MRFFAICFSNCSRDMQNAAAWAKNTNLYYQRENVQNVPNVHILYRYMLYIWTCVCSFNALNLSTYFRRVFAGNQVCRLSLSLQMLSEIYNKDRQRSSLSAL